MKTFILVVLILSWGKDLPAQSYQSTESEVTFFSSAPMEDIKATNEKATSLFNAATGDIAFVVPIQGFQFRKSLMQQHFNENYLESDKYPNATFEGKIAGYDPGNGSVQEAVAEGILTIHGVPRKVKINGQISRTPGGLKVETKFPLQVADYDIEIPRVVFYNIAEVVEVTAVFIYKEK
jgi:hypothetical protein